MSKQSKLLKISQIAKKAGVASSTIRYYTDMGLVSVDSTTPGGQRLYVEEYTVKKIRQIEWLSLKGKSISEIKKIIDNPAAKKFLIVDDDTAVCDLISDVIREKFGTEHEIKIAYDGFTAGKLLSDFLPDLILLDIYLPGVNGFEICKHIRRDKFLNDSKIIAMTGYDSPEHKKEILDSGADDYIAKPMDIALLEKKIKALL